ncbi:hypothetical protein ScPMuIL_013415 [Solemya velum]
MDGRCYNAVKPFNKMEADVFHLYIHYGTPQEDQQGQQCYFWRDGDVNTVPVMISGSKPGSRETTYKRYKVVCTRGRAKHAETGRNKIMDPITSGKELQDHTGDVAKETVVLTLVDVKGDEITQPAVQIGKLVRLRATIVGESSSAGIMAASCEAIGSTGSTSYRFIKGGCGDGYVIPKSDGFYSHGRSALSPVIQFFQIKGSDVIQFVCNFRCARTIVTG